MARENRERIVSLEEAGDFRVADGDPDVRGWDVLSADGRRIGEVDDLLIDTAAMKVRYLDVEIDDDLLGSDRDRHVLVPVGYARLDRDDNRVRVESLETSDVSNLPAYRSEPITREYEDQVRSGFDREYDAGRRAESSDYYDDPLFDDRRFYDARRDDPMV
jgi:photosynthetic reaction center H subunit